MLRLLGVALLATALATPHAVRAQMRLSSGEERWLDAGWQEEIGFAAANAVLSGVVTGLFRAFSDDGTFGEGFRDGAAGGAVTYLGKRVAAERFGGAGLIGRQIASVGGSMASNARDGRGPFDRLIFPLGLGRLYWDRVASSVAFRPDVVTLYYTTAAALESGVEIDWSHTFSAGTPVFLTSRGSSTLDNDAAGRTFAGVILIDVNADLTVSHIAAHERIHVLQYDHQFALWGEAVEREFVSMFGSGVSGVLGRADLGIGLVPLLPFIQLLPPESNPFEIEAHFLTVRGGY